MINCCSVFVEHCYSERIDVCKRKRTEHPLVVISHNASQSTIFEHTSGYLLIASELKLMVAEWVGRALCGGGGAGAAAAGPQCASSL